MSRRQASAALFHKEAPDCPQGPRFMMGDQHRVGCANGRQCRTVRPSHGGAVRAEYYARLTTPEGVRAMYVCPSCARVFAHVHGLPDVPAAGVPR